jgi:hypothetical protein
VILSIGNNANKKKHAKRRKNTMNKKRAKNHERKFTSPVNPRIELQ